MGNVCIEVMSRIFESLELMSVGSVRVTANWEWKCKF